MNGPELIFQCAACGHVEDSRAGITAECPNPDLADCLVERVQVDDHGTELRTWIA